MKPSASAADKEEALRKLVLANEDAYERFSETRKIEYRNRLRTALYEFNRACGNRVHLERLTLERDRLEPQTKVRWWTLLPVLLGAAAGTAISFGGPEALAAVLGITAIHVLRAQIYRDFLMAPLIIEIAKVQQDIADASYLIWFLSGVRVEEEQLRTLGDEVHDRIQNGTLHRVRYIDE